MTLEELLQIKVTTASGNIESAAMTVFTAGDLLRMGILWLNAVPLNGHCHIQ